MGIADFVIDALAIEGQIGDNETAFASSVAKQAAMKTVFPDGARSRIPVQSR